MRNAQRRTCRPLAQHLAFDDSAISDVVLHPPRMLRAMRGAAARSTRPSPSLRLRRAAARPLRSRTGARLVAGHPLVPSADDVALSRALAGVRRRRAGHAGRRLHAAHSCPPARRAAGDDASVHQGRIAQPHELVQGARAIGGDHTGARARRDDDRAAVGRKCRECGGGLRRPGRPRRQGLPAARCQTAVRSGMRALRRRRHAG